MSLVEARVEARRVLFCLDGNRMRRFRGRRNDARAPLSRFKLRETLLHAVPALECHISVPVNIGSHCTLASFCKGHARTLGFFMPQDPRLKHYSANWAHFHSYLRVKVAWLLQLKKPEPYIGNFQRIFLVYNAPMRGKTR